jgi:DNA-binding MarR family transcriptional regulator
VTAVPKPRFDAVIHAPNRLQICALLMPLEEAEFGVVRDRLEVSDSVLSKHLKQLGDAGYLRLRKSTYEGRPRTWAKLTRDGRRAFSAHVEEART